jgi:hypothetical protein
MFRDFRVGVLVLLLARQVVNFVEAFLCFGSADNVREYAFAKRLSNEDASNAIHGILLNGQPLAVFGDYRCTAVHQHSAVFHEGHVLLAVGGQVVCLRPSPFEFKWQLEVDEGACFGIHFHPELGALISHGELEIARFTDEGRILWASSGADIFSGGFLLLPNHIEAVDFNGRAYCFNYATGEEGV